MLDSSNGADEVPAYFGAAQLIWLQKYLHDHHDKPVILFTHFPVDARFASGSDVGRPLVLDGLLAECGNPNLGSIIGEDPYRSVKAIVNGHDHMVEYKEVNGIHFFGLPSVADSSSTPAAQTWPVSYLANAAAWIEAAFMNDRVTITVHGVTMRDGGASTVLLWRR